MFDIKNLRQNFRLTLITVIIVAVSGCAGRAPLKLVDPRDALPLAQLEHWELDARVAITTPDDNITASLEWQKNRSLFDFLISGAFGITYAHLVQEKTQATLDIPDHDTMIHQDAEALLQQALGWEFPIEALSFWIKGIPSGSPGEIIIRNQAGQIEQIQLGFWQIDFSKYKYYQGYQLPKMIKAQHPNIRIKVVARNWTFYQ